MVFKVIMKKYISESQIRTLIRKNLLKSRVIKEDVSEQKEVKSNPNLFDSHGDPKIIGFLQGYEQVVKKMYDEISEDDLAIDVIKEEGAALKKISKELPLELKNSFHNQIHHDYEESLRNIFYEFAVEIRTLTKQEHSFIINIIGANWPQFLKLIRKIDFSKVDEITDAYAKGISDMVLRVVKYRKKHNKFELVYNIDNSEQKSDNIGGDIVSGV